MSNEVVTHHSRGEACERILEVARFDPATFGSQIQRSNIRANLPGIRHTEFSMSNLVAGSQLAEVFQVSDAPQWVNAFFILS